jgi:phosphoribosylpyrophosphate synthetase
MLRALAACRARGAAHMRLVATRVFFEADAARRITDAAPNGVTVTDTACSIAFKASAPPLHRMSVAPIIGQCLSRMLNGQAISPLFDPKGMTR